MIKFNPTDKEDISEVVSLLKEGAVIMVKPYDDDYENFSGISMEDFENESEDEIIDYLIEKDEIEFWDEMIDI